MGAEREAFGSLWKPAGATGSSWRLVGKHSPDTVEKALGIRFIFLSADAKAPTLIKQTK